MKKLKERKQDLQTQKNRKTEGVVNAQMLSNFLCRLMKEYE